MNNNSGSNYEYTPREITWVNVQSPAGGTMMPGDDFYIYAQVYNNGITTENTESPNIQAWVGYSTTNSDPSTWAESIWKSASYNTKSGNNHEYVHNANDAALSAGTYYYASRFRYGDGSYYYGGFNSLGGNFWDGNDYVSGVLRFGKNSTAIGNWEDDTSWDGDAPVAGEHVFIKNGHTITINSNVNVNTITIETGGSLVVDGEYEITIGPNGSLKNDGSFSGAQSTIILNGTSVIEGSTETQFNNITVEGFDVTLNSGSTKVNGILELKAGSILNAPEFMEGSTLKYSQGGNYQRVTEWNNPWHVQIANETYLDFNIDGFSSNITINGDLIIDENSSATVDNGHTYDLIIAGDIFLNGTLSLSETIGSDLEIRGNWNRTGTFTHNDRLVTFNATSGTQELNNHTTFSYLKIDNAGSEMIMNAGITITEEMYVENAAVLNLQTHLIDGAGSFQLVLGGTLKIGHLDGITSSGATGNIQNTGSRTFGNPATYHYIGNGNQNSGDELPTASAAKNLIIELGSDDYEFRINTSTAVGIDTGGELEILSGKLIEASTATNGRHVEGAGNLVMSGGSYIIESTTTEGSTIRFPRLSGSYDNVTGGTIIFAGDSDFQNLRGGKKYHNLTFTEAGTKIVRNATVDINGTVLIENGAIVNSQSFTFGKSTTNLTMNGGRLILNGARTLPDMEGSYNLTGGVIEYAGSSDNHQVRGGKDYYNIDISGSNASTSGGNFNIIAGGTFTIKSGGQFTVASSRAIEGAGTFVIENNGTLLYGSANGITLQSEGTGTSTGNIRTSIRSFNENANYGFIGGVNQVSGNGLPANINNLIIDKTGGDVTLTNNLTVNGTLSLNSQNIDTDDKLLFLNNMDPASLIVGASNSDYTNSYIIGNFKRLLSDNPGYLFPVGTSTNLQLAEVDLNDLSTSGSAALTAYFTPDAGGDISALELFEGQPSPTLLTDRLNNGFWTFTPEDIASFTGDLRLNARGFTTDNENPKSFALIRNSGSGWELPDGVHNNLDQTFSTEIISVKRNGIESFSDWAIAYNKNDFTLPVVLKEFYASYLGKSDIALNWTTCSEINNEYFIIQRSTDARMFSDIEYVSGKGNYSGISEYSYFDRNLSPGYYYYRLKQVDFDGSFEYSKIIGIAVNQNQKGVEAYVENGHIMLYPNSINGRSFNYEIYDSSGRLLYKSFNNNFGEPVKSNFVPTYSGMLIIRIYTESHSTNERLMFY